MAISVQACSWVVYSLLDVTARNLEKFSKCPIHVQSLVNLVRSAINLVFGNWLTVSSPRHLDERNHFQLQTYRV